MDDNDAVTGEMDVELETVGAKGEAVIESRERVLGPERRAAAVGIDEGAGQDRARQRLDCTTGERGNRLTNEAN